MVDATHISFAANDRSYFSLLKKEIHQRAATAGLKATRLAELDIIVAEMTSNLFKYADQGELLFGLVQDLEAPYLELISIDSGPGMHSPTKMLVDGVSTSNTMGHGLGSIQRLSDTFDIYSQVGWGTILLSRIYLQDQPSKKAALRIRPLVVSKPGEAVSGDGFVYKTGKDYIKFMICDGLGHGPEANKAINEAAAAFRICPDLSPTDTLRFIHTAIKKTRGMVANVVLYDFKQKTWTSAGIGNIAARWLGPSVSKNHMSYNGIVGHNIPGTMNDQRYSSAEYNQLILCSDGIKTRWDLSKYPMIQKCDPTVLCAALYKDQARRTDDMSVVIVKLA